MFWQRAAQFLLIILGVGVLCALGCWQWHRAIEKQNMLLAYHAEANEKPVRWDAHLLKPSQYKRIEVQGRYGDPIFLLDNQYHEHQWGRHVLSPFWLDKEAVVMVDRGWIKGEVGGQGLPQVNTPSGTKILKGSVYYPRKNTWVGEENEIQPGAKMLVLEQFDGAYLSKILHQTVKPFIIRLAPEEPFGFVREWTVVSMPPERHKAYAFQWFALAILLAVLGVIHGVKKN